VLVMRYTNALECNRPSCIGFRQFYMNIYVYVPVGRMVCIGMLT